MAPPSSDQTIVSSDKKKENVSIEENPISRSGSDSSVHSLRHSISQQNLYNSIDRINDQKLQREKSWKQKIFSFSLDSYETEEERKFVRKLDFYLLSWACIAYMIKNVDQSNYKNAYVSGMKEDLNMTGNQYNLLGTFFTIGYAVAAIPFQLVMTKIKPSYLLGGCELLYGIFTCLCAIPQDNVKFLYACRFFIGAFESCSWSGVMYVFFNYYNNRELGFRAGLLGASAFIGQIITLFMQAAIYNNLGDHKIKSWQYLFLINGLMTAFVALFSLYLLPDSPANGGAVWMSKREVGIALKRVNDLGRVTQRRFRFKEFLKTFKDKHFYLLLLAYMPWDLGLNATSYITLWLKSVENPDHSAKYSVRQVNLIPIGGYVIGAISMIVITKFADVTQKRIHALVFQQTCGIIGCIVLSIWPSSLGLKYFGFFIMYIVQSTGAILMSFVPEIWAKNPERRAVITAIIVILDFSTNSWLPLLIWPAKEAPNYKYGYKFNLAFEVTSFIGCNVFYFYVYKRLKDSNELESQKKIQEEVRDLVA